MRRLLLTLAAIMLMMTGCHKDNVGPGMYMSVVYHGNGGLTANGDSFVKYTYLNNECEAISNCFTNGDKVFSKWNNKSDGSGYSNYQPGYTIYGHQADIDLYAIWLKVFTITYNANGGSGAMSSQTVTEGDYTYLTSNKFTRSGYQFDKWNTKANGSGTSYSNGAYIKPTANVTLWAQWKRVYTVTFNANGGSGTMSPQSIVAGESHSLNGNTFTKYHHVFKGWNTKADGSGTSYSNYGYITLNSDITLYAQWELNFLGGSINMCNGSTSMQTGAYYEFYDSGGPNSNYWHNEHYTYTFYAPAGKRVKIYFSSFNVDWNLGLSTMYDYMVINGVSYNDMDLSGQTIYSTGSSITIRFYSDDYYTSSGWVATVSSVD